MIPFHDKPRPPPLQVREEQLQRPFRQGIPQQLRPPEKPCRRVPPGIEVDVDLRRPDQHRPAGRRPAVEPMADPGRFVAGLRHPAGPRRERRDALRRRRRHRPGRHRHTRHQAGRRNPPPDRFGQERSGQQGQHRDDQLEVVIQKLQRSGHRQRRAGQPEEQEPARLRFGRAKPPGAERQPAGAGRGGQEQEPPGRGKFPDETRGVVQEDPPEVVDGVPGVVAERDAEKLAQHALPRTPGQARRGDRRQPGAEGDQDRPTPVRGDARRRRERQPEGERRDGEGHHVLVHERQSQEDARAGGRPGGGARHRPGEQQPNRRELAADQEDFRVEGDGAERSGVGVVEPRGAQAGPESEEAAAEGEHQQGVGQAEQDAGGVDGFRAVGDGLNAEVQQVLDRRFLLPDVRVKPAAPGQHVRHDHVARLVDADEGLSQVPHPHGEEQHGQQHPGADARQDAFPLAARGIRRVDVHAPVQPRSNRSKGPAGPDPAR